MLADGTFYINRLFATVDMIPKTVIAIGLAGVVQRFGNIQQLVEQTLDPMVSAYFKNTAQTKTLIKLLQESTNVQTRALADMRAKFAEYNLELQEVLIGTPRSPVGDTQIEVILAQLRDR